MTQRLFISYSRKDHAFARVLVNELRRRGADVFLDEQSMRVGDFVQQLGHEIEQRDVIVLLLSPHSVESMWVQSEIAWAFQQDKQIIPLRLDDATPQRNFWFLGRLQQIDVTGWASGGDISVGLHRLYDALGLPHQPQQPEPAADPEPVSEVVLAESTPDFSKQSVAQLFYSAVEKRQREPEEAFFLFEQVLRINPDYLDGEVQTIVAEEQARLRPQRIATRLHQARSALAQGQWQRAAQAARDALSLDPDNRDAHHIITHCEANEPCDTLYAEIVAAVGQEQWQAAHLLRDRLRGRCPDYGDPQRALTPPIEPNTLGWLDGRGVLGADGDPAITSLAFLPDGFLLAVGDMAGRVRLWDVTRRRRVATLGLHEGGVLTLAFNRDGTLLATGGADRTVCLIDVAGLRVLARLTEHRGAVVAAAFSPYDYINGDLLATGARDGRVRLWNAQTAGLLSEWVAHEGHHVYALAFNGNGQYLATGLADHAPIIWDVNVKLQPRSTDVFFNYEKFVQETFSQRDLTSAMVEASSVYAITFARDTTSPLADLAYRVNNPNPADISNWGDWWAVTGTKAGEVQIWQTNTITTKLTFNVNDHHAPVYAVAVNPAVNLIASGSADRTVRLWSMAQGTEVKRLLGHRGAVRAVAFSPDGTLLASGSDDGTIQLWGIG